MTGTKAAELELLHRQGCPAAQGPLGDPNDPDNPRKGTIRIEAYTVTGIGKYNRDTGEYGPAPHMGVVRCLECAAQSIVAAEDVPGIQRFLISLADPEESTDAA